MAVTVIFLVVAAHPVKQRKIFRIALAVFADGDGIVVGVSAVKVNAPHAVVVVGIVIKQSVMTAAGTADQRSRDRLIFFGRQFRKFAGESADPGGTGEGETGVEVFFHKGGQRLDGAQIVRIKSPGVAVFPCQTVVSADENGFAVKGDASRKRGVFSAVGKPQIDDIRLSQGLD